MRDNGTIELQCELFPLFEMERIKPRSTNTQHINMSLNAAGSTAHTHTHIQKAHIRAKTEEKTCFLLARQCN